MRESAYAGAEGKGEHTGLRGSREPVMGSLEAWEGKT